MSYRPAYRKFGMTAEKWLEHAEKRRDYFRDLHSSGGWRRYYTEEQFVARLRDVARACDRWETIVAQMRLPSERYAQFDVREHRSAA